MQRLARPILRSIAARPLLPVLLLSLGLTTAARSEEVGYSLDAAAGLFWHIELAGDDGVTGASDHVVLFCCAENEAVVRGERVGVVDPSFTPASLTHRLQPAPLALQVGALPVLLDVSGSLTWSPPSGPSLMTGESGPLETGPLTAALFTGTLTTPLGSLPFGRSLLQHSGGDTSLRRFAGETELGPPRLRMSSALQLLDSLEIDEEDVAGRVEMRSPYEALLTTSTGAVEAGSVSYALDGAAGLFWEITITGDDGVQPPSSDTVFVFQGLDASITGTTSGIVDPVFTPDSVTHSIAGSGIALQVGAHPVVLDLAGSLGWTPSGPSLASGQEAPMPTGDASGAAFVGALATPFGEVPFDLGLGDHVGGDTSLVRLSGTTELGPPRLQLNSTSGPLDSLELDEADAAGRVDMRAPYEAILGSSGGVTWSLAARVFFNDAFHALVPAPPNGASRNVAWSLRAEVLFNDVFHLEDPDLTPATVPALGGAGRTVLVVLLLAGALGMQRLRRIRSATSFR